MLVLLFLVSLATATTTDHHILKIYEDPNHDQFEDESAYSCVSDCHQHILNDEVYILLRDHNNEEIPYTRVFAPHGLNGLLNSPLKGMIITYLESKDAVGIIYSSKSFRSELYPGVMDAEVIIPEHVTTLRKLHEYKPVLVLIPKEEFAAFNAKKGYTPIVDMLLDPTGFHVVMDYASVNRLLVKPKPRFGFDIHFNP